MSENYNTDENTVNQEDSIIQKSSFDNNNPKKVGLTPKQIGWIIFKYLVASFLLLASLTYIANSPFSSILFFLASILSFPFITSLLKNKFNLKINSILKSIIIVALFFGGISLIDTESDLSGKKYIESEEQRKEKLAFIESSYNTLAQISIDYTAELDLENIEECRNENIPSSEIYLADPLYLNIFKDPETKLYEEDWKWTNSDLLTSFKSLPNLTEDLDIINTEKNLQSVLSSNKIFLLQEDLKSLPLKFDETDEEGYDFVTGFYIGNLVLFDIEKKQSLCILPFDVESSDELYFTDLNAQQVLDEDFTEQFKIGVMKVINDVNSSTVIKL